MTTRKSPLPSVFIVVCMPAALRRKKSIHDFISSTLQAIKKQEREGEKEFKDVAITFYYSNRLPTKEELTIKVTLTTDGVDSSYDLRSICPLQSIHVGIIDQMAVTIAAEVRASIKKSRNKNLTRAAVVVQMGVSQRDFQACNHQ